MDQEVCAGRTSQLDLRVGMAMEKRALHNFFLEKDRRLAELAEENLGLPVRPSTHIAFCIMLLVRSQTEAQSERLRAGLQRLTFTGDRGTQQLRDGTFLLRTHPSNVPSRHSGLLRRLREPLDVRLVLSVLTLVFRVSALESLGTLRDRR